MRRLGATFMVIENYIKKERERNFVVYFYSYRKLHKKVEEKDLWATFIIIENYIKKREGFVGYFYSYRKKERNINIF